MSAYFIEFTEDAKQDLSYYKAFERKIITTEIRVQLAHQPLVETQNRKPIRENPIASWELRIGIYRAFYEVNEFTVTVTIVAAGHKTHNVLYIRGKEVKL